MPKISAAQLQSTSSLDDNFLQIRQLLEASKAQQSDFLVLPEECLTLGMPEQEKLQIACETESISKRLSLFARQFKSWLVVGSVPVYADESHFFSTMIVFDEKGDQVASYQKIHLFDVRVSPKQVYQESKLTKAGSRPVIVNTPLGCAGLSICYDVRFPELYRLLCKRGAQLLLVPSAFTPQTGQAHWHVLMRARAIENLCYVIAPNQNGIRANGESTYGHSLVVSPWGEILAEIEEGVGVITVDIELDRLKEIRSRFPVLEHQTINTGAM